MPCRNEQCEGAVWAGDFCKRCYHTRHLSESAIESKCCVLARAAGFLSMKFVSPGTRGVPDRIFIGPRIFFVEFKRVGGKVRIEQERAIAKMRAHGAEVHVINQVEAFRLLLEAPAAAVCSPEPAAPEHS